MCQYEQAGSVFQKTPVRVKYCSAMNRKSNKSRKTRRTNRRYEDTIARDFLVARNPVRTLKVVLTINGTISSSAGGVISGAFGMDPSGSAEWSSYAVLYDQFRVIGGILKLASSVPMGSTTASNTIVAFCFDNDNATTPTAYSGVTTFSETTNVPAVWSSGSIKQIRFKRPKIGNVMQTQYQWYDEATPSASPGAIKFYGSGASNSVQYYNYILEYLVEFQMRS